MADEPNVYSRQDLTYNGYLKVPELLALQQPLSRPAHHDEMLFIVIHQAYELWFKLILHELAQAVVHMKERQALRAHHFIRRSVEIMKLLVQQIHILETMTPVDFLQFRDQLNPASGFQSLQFRECEFFLGLKDQRYFHFFKNRPEMLEVLERRFKEPDMRDHYFELLRSFKFPVPTDASTLEREPDHQKRKPTMEAIRPIYQEPEKHLELYLLSEGLVELDEYLALWREHHVHVVERVIGYKMGTGGSSGVGYLQSTTSKRCFPSLWDVRTLLTKC